MDGWLWTIIIGGVAGYIGSLLFKGTGSGILINIVLGILGGWFGGWIFGQLGFTGPGYFFTAIIGAFLLCWIFSLFSRRT